MTSQLGANRATIPQGFKISPNQVFNHAGGAVWNLSPREHVMRYLIMGAKDNGNYYQTPEQVSSECNTSVLQMIHSQNPDDFKTLCAMIESVSVDGRAAKQEPTMLSLAAAIVFASTFEQKQIALALIPNCVRIPTHLFMLVSYINDLSQCKPESGKGFGRGVRRELTQYYTKQSGLALATAVTKYKNREGWCHVDLIRMLHINSSQLKDDGARLVFKYLFACNKGEKEFMHKLLSDITIAKTKEQAMQLLDTQKFTVVESSENLQQQPPRELIDTAKYLLAVMEIENCTTSSIDVARAVKLVQNYGLAREHIPTHMLNCSEIWKELLMSKGANGKKEGMPLEAMLRNLGKMSSLPYFMGHHASTICTRMSSDDDIRSSRIHPFKVLVGAMTYGTGNALKGSLSWTVSPSVRDTLTQTFLKAFKNVKPTGKNFMIGLDVSGSMDCRCMGCPAISCRQASAALALMLYETEPSVSVRGFSAAYMSSSGFYNFDSYVKHGMTLDQFITATSASFGPTDCSLPMRRAIEEGSKHIDVFIIMTDNETFAGPVHPQVALENYRKFANKPDAKLIVVGMTANSLTIADPNDRNTLNLAGFDTAMPEIISMFVRGEL
jgi:60 kDa SS-A/Ro ribonucleoprotein